VYPGWWNFKFYCPAKADESIVDYFCGRMQIQGAKLIGRADFEQIFREYTDLGEINPHYIGLQEVYNNFVLVMTWPSGRGAGFLVFKPKSEVLVEIDIIALQEELRSLGLARYMYGFFESACKDGTLLFIVSVTEQGWQFYSRCGYQQDIDTFKILAKDNRVVPHDYYLSPIKADIKK
jgi:GNAT superfamily N-acetyltransferase